MSGIVGRIKELVDLIIARVLAPYDYMGLYPSKVVSQSDDGTTVDLVPDKPTLPHTRARLRLGLPGTSIKIQPGSRVLLGFENGDPRTPVATLWEPDAAVVSITMGGPGIARAIARAGDPAALVFPPVIPVIITVGGTPSPAILQILTPLTAIIAAGSSKVRAAS